MLEAHREVSVLGYTVLGSLPPPSARLVAVAARPAGSRRGLEARALGSSVSALRLDVDQVEQLKQFGLKTMASSMSATAGAAGPLGVSLLLRLDQALGWIEEKSHRAFHLPTIRERRFPSPRSDRRCVAHRA